MPGAEIERGREASSSIIYKVLAVYSQLLWGRGEGRKQTINPCKTSTSRLPLPPLILDPGAADRADWKKLKLSPTRMQKLEKT